MNLRSTFIAAVFGFGMSQAGATERETTLLVENMTCAACPTIVEGSLEAVPGVTNVEVSFEHKTAVVTFDDAITGPEALIKATTNAGYPSAAKL